MAAPASEDHWVFGFGSLMWRPGFDFVERLQAVHHGRRRAFCIYSVHHRGTPERPGLVLGLAPGGAVRGVAYRIAAKSWDQTYAYLLQREQPTETYVEATITLRHEKSAPFPALAFLSDRQHPQWAGNLSLNAQADLIAGARGLSGPNTDYLRDLVAHLREGGIRDQAMERLLSLVAIQEAKLQEA